LISKALWAARRIVIATSRLLAVGTAVGWGLALITVGFLATGRRAAV
jgi:hypothetical protein